VDQLTFEHLQWITFDIRFDSTASITNKECKPLDDRLSMSDAKHLQANAFRYTGRVEKEAASKRIRRLFPSVASQGNLEIYYDSL